MNELITVIVPVYNVKSYLSRCIDSILAQVYTNLEVILVDDGSTDGSGDVCDDYARKDTRIIVVHKENGGLSDARNAGLDIASGGYVVFVDSDDFVTKYYIENLYLGIKKSNTDMAVSGFINWYEGNQILKGMRVNNKDIEVVSNIECMKKILYQDKLDILACAKLYSIRLFENIRYPKGKLYEDIITTWPILKLCQNISIVNSYDYMYFQRKDSIQHRKFDERKLDSVMHWNMVLDDVEKNYPELKSACYCRCLSGLFNIIFQIPNYEYKEIQKNLWNQIRKYRFKVLFDRKSRRKTRFAVIISYFGKTVTKFIYKQQKIFFKSKGEV